MILYNHCTTTSINHKRLRRASARTELLYQVTDALNYSLLSLFIQDAILTGSHQPEDLLRKHSAAVFFRYPQASCLSKKGFHHRRLYSKAYNLTFIVKSKILWTVTITKISFSVVQNTCNKFFFYIRNLFKRSFENS